MIVSKILVKNAHINPGHPIGLAFKILVAKRITIPAVIPNAAPALVQPFQYKPSKNAGASCASPVYATSCTICTSVSGGSSAIIPQATAIASTMLLDKSIFCLSDIFPFLFNNTRSWDTIWEETRSIALIVEIPAAIAAAITSAATNQLECKSIRTGKMLSAAPTCSGVASKCPAKPINKVANP